MKKMTVLILLGIVVLGISAVAVANVGVKLRVNIPFAFYADKALMPAGEYIFDIGSAGFGAATSSAVLIHNESGDVVRWLLTVPGTAMSESDSHLHFNRYGSKYFLTKIEGAGYQANTKTTAAEKELRAQNQTPTDTRVAAGK